MDEQEELRVAENSFALAESWKVLAVDFGDGDLTSEFDSKLGKDWRKKKKVSVERKVEERGKKTNLERAFCN